MAQLEGRVERKMTERSEQRKANAAAKKRPKIGKLNLTTETIDSVTDEQAEAVKVGTGNLCHAGVKALGK